MRRFLVLAVVSLILLGGCSHPDQESNANLANTASPMKSNGMPGAPSGTGKSEGVSPIGSPGAGGMTPMSGGDNMGSSAGAVGNAAKRQAQQMSGKAGSAETGGDQGTTG